ncbi:MAG: NAD(P)-dependent alcohol dehydrogenase [Ignavibacteriales bacterium]|nr:NAD(P)-dependent alcohol dehydrogenase [Ignavibacteriales bacterium]
MRTARSAGRTRPKLVISRPPSWPGNEAKPLPGSRSSKGNDHEPLISPPPKAIVYAQFGSPDVLRLEEVPRPEPRRGEILVRVRAAGVNFGDLMARSFRSVTPRGFNMPFLFWLFAKTAIGWRKPRIRVLGNEFAGDVVAAGRDVERFKPGDPVFGYVGERFGARAEFLLPAGKRSRGSHKPAGLSYEEAAVIPYGALMASSLLRRADLRPGRRILVNGASGGIGSAAVQIAKHLGADVTAVCGGPRLAYVRALGADRSSTTPRRTSAAAPTPTTSSSTSWARRPSPASGASWAPGASICAPASRAGISWPWPGHPSAAAGGSSARWPPRVSRTCSRSASWPKRSRSGPFSAGASRWRRPPRPSAISSRDRPKAKSSW